MITKDIVEDLVLEANEEVLNILMLNDEQLTENSNGYFFDLTKLKGTTKKALSDLWQKVVEMKRIRVEDSATMNKKFVKENEENVDDMSKCRTVRKAHGNELEVPVSPKFINEYNNDFMKNNKSASMIKFLNAKKKYMRNFESLQTRNEFDLKREEYI